MSSMTPVLGTKHMAKCKPLCNEYRVVVKPVSHPMVLYLEWMFPVRCGTCFQNCSAGHARPHVVEKPRPVPGSVSNIYRYYIVAVST